MASSSSSSSPFVTEENNNNNNNNNNENENNDQSKNKQMNESFKFLEEDLSNVAPPPAYEDIEKPPPTLPGYNNSGQQISNDLSYPPPRAQPTENYNRPNFFSTPSNSSNFNKRNDAIACCGSSRNKNCGCGWLIVLIIFVILTAISVINNNVCSKLTLGESQIFSFDPTTANILLIDVDTSRIKRGDIRIFTGRPNQQQVEIEVLTGSNGVTPKFVESNRNGIYELDISQTSGFSLFNIPPRCMKMQANVFLPLSSSTTIQVKELDIIVNNGAEYQNISLTTDTGDIIFSDGVSAQTVNLRTIDGDMLLKNTTVKGSLNITTFDGDIEGSIYLSDKLSVRTTDGDVDLILKIAQGANTNIGITTVDGDVGLRFDNTFSGNYAVQTGDGAIRFDNRVIDGGRATGTFGTGGSNLTVVSADDGNIFVSF